MAFACFTAPNCQPAGGDFIGEGGSGDGGNSGNGGSGSGGKATGGAGGGASGSGGSGTSSGGSDSTGGKSSSGGNAGGGGKSNGGNAGSGNGGSAGSGSGGNSTGGAASTGGATSGGGTTTATTPTAGSTGSSGATQKCSPTTATTPAITSTGGLACPGGLCTVGSYSGYIYVYADGSPSKVCAAAESLCASGSTGAADAKGTIWGAGVGFNLDKSATPAAVQLAGTGITYALSAMPTQGMRVQVTVGTTDYCAKLSAASGTVAWTDFNTACWDNSGTKLTAAPSTPHVGFQVTAATAAGTFDFCVTKVTLQ